MMGHQWKVRICILLLILNLCFIWGNSMLPAEESQAISDWVEEILPDLTQVADAEEEGFSLYRKIAHLTEFTVLGALLSWLAMLLQKKHKWMLVWGMLTACMDETIQMFVPDRGPSILDVGIDVCGVLLGMVLLQLGYDVVRKICNAHFGG